MNFNTSLHELDRLARETLAAVEASRKLYDQEGIADPTVSDVLTGVGEQLSALRAALEGTVAASAATFDMIRFLNDALTLEYRHIIEFERYADIVEEAPLAESLRRFGAEERRHAHALSMKIIELGGVPQFSAEHELREDMTAVELLSLHIETEERLVKLYESGLERYDDSAVCWLIGKIKVDEDDHLRRLRRLLDDYRDRAVLVEEAKNFTWVDPTMGTPGDRAWIE